MDLISSLSESISVATFVLHVSNISLRNKKIIFYFLTLYFRHLVVDTTVQGHAIQMIGEVGLLSRNIKFRGNNNPLWHEEIEACPDGFDTGMFTSQHGA